MLRYAASAGDDARRVGRRARRASAVRARLVRGRVSPALDRGARRDRARRPHARRGHGLRVSVRRAAPGPVRRLRRRIRRNRASRPTTCWHPRRASRASSPSRKEMCHRRAGSTSAGCTWRHATSVSSCHGPARCSSTSCPRSGSAIGRAPSCTTACARRSACSGSSRAAATCRGASPSRSSSSADSADYGYAPCGMPSSHSSRSTPMTLVVSPYSSYLALLVDRPCALREPAPPRSPRLRRAVWLLRSARLLARKSGAGAIVDVPSPGDEPAGGSGGAASTIAEGRLPFGAAGARDGAAARRTRATNRGSRQAAPPCVLWPEESAA